MTEAQWLQLAAGVFGAVGSICLGVPPARDLKNRRFWDKIAKFRGKNDLKPETVEKIRNDLLDDILGGYEANRLYTVVGLGFLTLGFCALIWASLL